MNPTEKNFSFVPYAPCEWIDRVYTNPEEPLRHQRFDLRHFALEPAFILDGMPKQVSKKSTKYGQILPVIQRGASELLAIRTTLKGNNYLTDQHIDELCFISRHSPKHISVVRNTMSVRDVNDPNDWRESDHYSQFMLNFFEVTTCEKDWVHFETFWTTPALQYFPYSGANYVFWEITRYYKTLSSSWGELITAKPIVELGKGLLCFCRKFGKINCKHLEEITPPHEIGERIVRMQEGEFSILHKNFFSNSIPPLFKKEEAFSYDRWDEAGNEWLAWDKDTFQDPIVVAHVPSSLHPKKLSDDPDQRLKQKTAISIFIFLLYTDKAGILRKKILYKGSTWEEYKQNHGGVGSDSWIIAERNTYYPFVLLKWLQFLSRIKKFPLYEWNTTPEEVKQLLIIAQPEHNDD